jgi:hypothetical protein
MPTERNLLIITRCLITIRLIWNWQMMDETSIIHFNQNDYDARFEMLQFERNVNIPLHIRDL